MIDRENELLMGHLTEQGLSQPEIDGVIAKLREHDKRTIHESVFDSIERGTFNLQTVIAEVKDANKTGTTG